MDELVFDGARSVIVGSTLRAFAADGRPTTEVERLLVHVARTASAPDLVEVAYDLAARVLSPAAWDRLAEEPWLAAELEAPEAPVEVRLVVTGATPEQVRRLLDRPVEVLGEALGLLDGPDEGAEETGPPVGHPDAVSQPAVSQPDEAQPDEPRAAVSLPAVSQPAEFREVGDGVGPAEPQPDEPQTAVSLPAVSQPAELREVGDGEGVGPDVVHEDLGVRPSSASSRRARRRGGPALRAARRPGSSPGGSRPSAARPPQPCGPRDTSGSTAHQAAHVGARMSGGSARGPAAGWSRPARRRPSRPRQRSGPVDGPPRGAECGSPRASRRGTAGAERRCLPDGHGMSGSRSRDGPDVVSVASRVRTVGCARRGGARTVTT